MYARLCIYDDNSHNIYVYIHTYIFTLLPKRLKVLLVKLCDDNYVILFNRHFLQKTNHQTNTQAYTQISHTFDNFLSKISFSVLVHCSRVVVIFLSINHQSYVTKKNIHNRSFTKKKKIKKIIISIRVFFFCFSIEMQRDMRKESIFIKKQCKTKPKKRKSKKRNEKESVTILRLYCNAIIIDLIIRGTI